MDINNKEFSQLKSWVKLEPAKSKSKKKNN